MRKNTLLELFFTFAKIGLFTIGGGYAMLPLIEDTCVDKKKWISHDEMMDITVIAESTPGPVAINCATFVGYKQKGIVGALIATLGMILSSFVIILAISFFLDNFLEITIIANAFKGIKLAVGILIIFTAIRMFKKIPKKPMPLIILVAALVAMMIINMLSIRFSSIYLMLIAGVVSLFVFFAKTKIGKKGGEKA